MTQERPAFLHPYEDTEYSQNDFSVDSKNRRTPRTIVENKINALVQPETSNKVKEHLQRKL